MADDTILTPASASALVDAITADPTKYLDNTTVYSDEYAQPVVYGSTAAGKKKFIIDTTNIDLVFSKKNIKNLKRKPNIADCVRGQSGNFWSFEGPDKKAAAKNLQYFSMDKKNTGPAPFKLHFNKMQSAPIKTSSSSFGATREWVLIEANTDLFKVNGEFAPSWWNAYLEGGTYGGVKYEPTVKIDKAYSDHAFVMPLPYPKKELERLNSPMGTQYASVIPEYNFFIDKYEPTISNRLVKEPTLPNMYAFLVDMDHDEDPSPVYDDLITLGGSLKSEHTEVMKRQQKESKEAPTSVAAKKNMKYDVQTNAIGQYFDMYARQYNNAIKAGSINRISKQWSNIAVPISDMKIFNDYNERREMFPMYTDIEFSTDKTTQLAQVLEDTSMSSAMLADMIDAVTKNTMPRKSMMEATQTSIMPINFDSTGAAKVTTRTVFQRTKFRTFDLTQWYEKFADLESMKLTDDAIDFFDGYTGFDRVFLGSYANESKMKNSPQYSFFKSLMLIIFAGKLKKILESHSRSLKEVMEGKEAYSETACYRIAKFAGKKATGKPLQNFWLPNSNSIDVLRFIDTQVKYNKEYTYVIYAYQFVVGTKYRYVKLETGEAGTNGKFAAVEVYHEPSLQLVEVPIHEHTGRIMDKPPLWPDIQLVPYKGINDKILVTGNGNVGDYHLQPVTIEPTDQALWDKARKVQDLLPDEPIHFGADDHPAFFEMYRCDFHPSAYTDFAGKRIARVSSDVSAETAQNATAASWIEKVEPNRKYYYTFRVVDNHGHISNPTPIYQVEMMDDKGSIFLDVEIVPLADRVPRDVSKGMKRFMQLVPTMQQSLLNREDSGIAEADSVLGTTSVKLGNTDDSIWGKKFRIRLTSKSTGKKIDFDVKFDHKHLKSDIDQQ